MGSLVCGRTGAAWFCSSVTAEPALCHAPLGPSSTLHRHLLPGRSVSEGNPQNCGLCAGEQPWSQLCQPGHPLRGVRGVQGWKRHSPGISQGPLGTAGAARPCSAAPLPGTPGSAPPAWSPCDLSDFPRPRCGALPRGDISWEPSPSAGLQLGCCCLMDLPTKALPRSFAPSCLEPQTCSAVCFLQREQGEEQPSGCPELG